MADDANTNTTFTKAMAKGFNSSASLTVSPDKIVTYEYKTVAHPGLIEGNLLYITPKGEDRHIIPEHDHHKIEEQLKAGKVLVERPFVMDFSDPDLEQKIELNAMADQMMAKITPEHYERAANAQSITRDEKLKSTFNNLDKTDSTLDISHKPSTHDIA